MFRRNAQFLSIDFFVSLTGAIFALLLILLSWHYISDFGADRQLITDMERVTHHGAITLFGTAGMPVYWDNVSASSIASVGLLTADGLLLSMDKLYALNRTDVSYGAWQELLGVLGPGYDYFISSHTIDQEELLFVGEAATDAAQVSVREVVLYNGTDPVIVRLGVWV